MRQETNKGFLDSKEQLFHGSNRSFEKDLQKIHFCIILLFGGHKLKLAIHNALTNRTEVRNPK
jgi:hypothetical protein